MDITHEVAISTAQPLPHSPSNPDSDQNKRRNVATGIHMQFQKKMKMPIKSPKG